MAAARFFVRMQQLIKQIRHWFLNMHSSNVIEIMTISAAGKKAVDNIAVGFM